MSDAGWDDDDFEPAVPAPAATDKWEGEDEDDIKDSWDAEDEKKTESGEEGAVKAVQRKKKKPLAERIAEKEAARLAELEREKEENKVMTREERNAEAERLRKIQEEADLKLAKEAFGVDSTGIDAMFPVTNEDFVKFKDALKTKISHFSSSSGYGTFINQLLNDLMLEMSLDDAKKVSLTAASIFHEKQRQQKETDKKKKKKNKGVALMERDTDFGDLAAAGRGDYDDGYDDDFI